MTGKDAVKLVLVGDNSLLLQLRINDGLAHNFIGTLIMKKSMLASSMLLTSAAGYAFDAASLLSVELNTEEFDIERTLIPEGDWEYRIGKPKISSGEKDGKPWAQLTLPLECIDQEVLKELNVEKISTRTQFFLDLDENGRLAKGTNMNIALGRAFEAAGLRGEEATILQLEGRVVIGSTKQKKAESGAEYNEVNRLAMKD